MGPLDGGMVLIGKKFSQYLNSQGDPLLTRLSKGYPLSHSESEVSQRDIAANAGGKDNSED